VWIVLAGVAILAAFPRWYATLFSGLHVALVFVVAVVIVHGAAIELRSKSRSPRWRRGWDWTIFTTSLALAVLWGAAMGNLLAGVPIDANRQFVGGPLDLVSPYTLVCSLASLGAFVTHGALFLHLKSTEPIRHRSMAVVRSIGPVATLMILLFVVATYYWTDAFSRLGPYPGLLPLTAFAAMLGAGAFVHLARDGWAFLMTSIAMAASTATIFESLYPRVMVSSLNPDWSLTIYNTASAPFTLKMASIAAVIFLPIILGGLARTYWVGRHPVTHATHLEY